MSRKQQAATTNINIQGKDKYTVWTIGRHPSDGKDFIKILRGKILKQKLLNKF
jgi:hypothetical protein